MLGALVLFAGCDVYNQALLDGSQADAGESGIDATGGMPMGGGTGGSLVGGAGVSGGASGSGASGGSSGSSGTQGGSGRGGDGGSDSGSGGTSSGGKAGSGTSGDGGDSGSSGEGGTAGGSAGAGNGGMPSGGAGAAGTSGGGAGNAGSGNGGAGNGGAGAGGAGTGGAGTGGAGEVCTGCARLSVPLATGTDQAHFTIGLPAVTDFRTATIAIRVARYAGTGGWFKAYIQEGSPNYLYQDSVETTIASIGTSIQTITWDVATAGTTADKSVIRRIGIEVSGAGGGTFTNPTVLYVDSITIMGATPAVPSFTFDTSSTVLTTPTSNGPNDVMWLNNYSADTNVTGATLSWLGP